MGSKKEHEEALKKMEEKSKLCKTEYERLTEWAKMINSKEMKEFKPEEKGYNYASWKKSSKDDKELDEFLDIFDPKFFLRNGEKKIEKHLQEVQATIVGMPALKKDGKDGDILEPAHYECKYSWRLVGPFSNKLNPRGYPFDCNILLIRVMTKLDTDKVQFVPIKKYDEKKEKYVPADGDNIIDKCKTFGFEIFQHLMLKKYEKIERKYDEIAVAMFICRTNIS